MLRAALLVVGVLLLAGGIFATLEGRPLIPLIISGTVLILALLFERYSYKPIRSVTPGPGGQRTPEQFVDPRSGRTVTVYFNPRSGERRYVADGDG
jgi:hypothetical protein